MVVTDVVVVVVLADGSSGDDAVCGLCQRGWR